MKCKTGVFVDVFPMDDVPLGVGGQILQDFWCMCLRKVLWSEVGRLDPRVSAPLRAWFSLLSKIPAKAVYALASPMERKSTDDSPNRVRTLLFPATGTLYRENPLEERYAMPKEWFKDLSEYEFEGKRLMGTRDFDAILTYIYGDYMQLPPEDRRGQHSPVSSYEF